MARYRGGAVAASAAARRAADDNVEGVYDPGDQRERLVDWIKIFIHLGDDEGFKRRRQRRRYERDSYALSPLVAALSPMGPSPLSFLLP
jgi:hypothetical protein